ncbi:hypothetical protein ABZ721_33160 [Streptomyces sp. NPDC006733]|uniref:hypothetical protein n=1 Tax=Streptomyces sp. NPDC006733 TaxID=3155460 RepID=UPI0033E87BE6
MARYTAPVTPLHADNTPCGHPVTSTGKPKDPASGCTGRTHYRAACSCSWSTTCDARILAADARTQHLRTHLTAPAA